MTMTADPIPVIYFPRRANEPPDPVPFVLTEHDMIRLLRLDDVKVKEPGKTLARYRKMGLLKGTRVGLKICYQLPDVLRFLNRSQEVNPCG
jgi:hypothetical protein